MTVTVTPTSGVISPNQANITSSSGGLGVGASVGIAIGVISAAVLAGVAGFCVWRRKKQREDDAHGVFRTPSPRGSSAGMTSSPKAAEAGMTPPFLARNPDGTYESDYSGRRRSLLMPIDPRIDPTHTAIYNRDGNKSHESVNTLRDDQDYSRRVHQPNKVLRATNPDPDDD
jgi:cell wall integrity and stress response component